ncbi:hypothetical protein D6D17_05352 [Aureobasidium pullulans]|nr:hypothetical protein D6D17_05352 [Aureobasidium pullulans]
MLRGPWFYHTDFLDRMIAQNKLYDAQMLTSIQDYDNDRWRFISSKVGSGFSAAACKAKAEEIEAEDMEAEVGAESGSEDDRHNTFGRQDIEEEDQNEEEQ